MNEEYRGENPTEAFTISQANRDERGFIELSWQNARRLTVGGAVVGLVLGFVHNFGPLVETETDISFSAGKGFLESVDATLEPDCKWQYQNRVEGASASFSFRPRVLGVPGPTMSMSETFNGEMTNKVCNKKSAVTVKYNPGTKKFTLSLSAKDPFVDTVYRTNPFSDEFDHDNGAVTAILESAGSLINALPEIGSIKPSANTGNDLSNYLQGGALLMATETSAHACGPKAWDHAKPLYAKALVDEYYTEAKQLADAKGKKFPYTKDDFIADLPEDIGFVSQYEDLYKNLKALKSSKSLKFHVPSVKDMVCKDMPVDKTGVPNG
jgi:hypothetical protein